MEQKAKTARPGVTAAVVIFSLATPIAMAFLANDYTNGDGLFASSQPSVQMTSIGVARLQSCRYKGAFVGGSGYDCVVRNVSPNEIRDVSSTSCAGFDSSGRLIHSPERVADLYGAAMGPGEERIVRVYVPEEASAAVCSETGDIGSPIQLRSIKASLAESNLISVFSI